MTDIVFRKGDQFLGVTVGWSLRPRRGEVTLEKLDQEAALHKGVAAFDLDHKIMVGRRIYPKFLGRSDRCPILQQGQVKAVVPSARCDGFTLVRNARRLMQLRS
jgi:hypothetical protein